MNRVVLSLGGNIGDKVENFREVVLLIEEKIGVIVKSSKIYESEAWGFESSDIFFNQVVVVDTLLSGEELLEVNWEIERIFGRSRGTADRERVKYEERLSSEVPIYHSRQMDIDILYFNDDIISTPLLTIPHPEIDKREFILIPLRELGYK